MTSNGEIEQLRCYGLDGVAEKLGGVSKSTIRKHIREGRLPAKRLGGRVVVTHDDLKAFVDGLKPAKAA